MPDRPGTTDAADRTDPAIDGAGDDGDAPLACALDGPDLTDRIARIGELRARAVAVDRTPGGIVLWFRRSSVAGELERFVADERRCCSFWDLAVIDGHDAGTDGRPNDDPSSDRIGLRWLGPPDTQPFLDRLAARRTPRR